jgi:hypothetical protein
VIIREDVAFDDRAYPTEKKQELAHDVLIFTIVLLWERERTRNQTTRWPWERWRSESFGFARVTLFGRPELGYPGGKEPPP